MQRPRTARRSVRLEERNGRNRCKVDDGSLSLHGMPSLSDAKIRSGGFGDAKSQARCFCFDGCWGEGLGVLCTEAGCRAFMAARQVQSGLLQDAARNASKSSHQFLRPKT